MDIHPVVISLGMIYVIIYIQLIIIRRIKPRSFIINPIVAGPAPGVWLKIRVIIGAIIKRSGWGIKVTCKVIGATAVVIIVKIIAAHRIRGVLSCPGLGSPEVAKTDG
jgi:hypothetical protein